MQIILVEFVSRNQQAAPLLQDPIFRLPSLVFFVPGIALVHIIVPAVALLIQIQHNLPAQTHRRNKWVICSPVLMRHDPLPGLVLIHEDMVWGVVRGVGEEVQIGEIGGYDGGG